MSYQFKDKRGRTITLEDRGSRIEAFEGQTQIGHIEWDERSIDVDAEGDDVYGALICHAYLDKSLGYTNSGIGSEIVRYIANETGMPVLVLRDNGTTRSDGAHPTGDAPGFYESLVKKTTRILLAVRA
jgi:hypothetical protein